MVWTIQRSSSQTVHGSTDPDTIAYTLVRSSLSGNESSRTSHCFLTWDYHHGKRSFLVTGNRIMEFLYVFSRPSTPHDTLPVKNAIPDPPNPTQNCIPTVITITISSSFVNFFPPAPQIMKSYSRSFFFCSRRFFLTFWLFTVRENYLYSNEKTTCTVMVVKILMAHCSIDNNA